MIKRDVSIIMSVYNDQETLSKSILSILRQSFKNFEFMIIDDGSIDNSKKILRYYKKIDKSDTQQEKIEINGIKVSKKLLNRESLQSCPVCGSFPKKSMDDVCFVKFDCCFECYVKYVEGREERWQKGWRPDNGNSL